MPTMIALTNGLFFILLLIFMVATADLPYGYDHHLDKPHLLENFGLFDDAIKENLPKVNSQVNQWPPGWILQNCKDLTEAQKLNPADVTTLRVLYDDCEAPWLLCYHKSSPNPVWYFIELFGRIPVRARSHIKGMITFPGTGNGAYNQHEYIALTNRKIGVDIHDWSQLAVMIHETAHSLDWNGYPDGTLSASKKWEDAYNQDSKVPDSYAATNFREDMAQSSVVAPYDLNVPGGLGTLDRDWQSIQHQYELIRSEQASAANLLVPGGRCTQRVPNSEVVQISTKKSRRGLRGIAMMEGKPNVDLPAGLEVIHQRGNFSTKGSCLYAL